MQYTHTIYSAALDYADLALVDEPAMPDAADYPSLAAYLDALEEWDAAEEAIAYCDARYDGLVH